MNVYAGAAVDYTEGFVGCMRALQVNGEMLDLMGKVERGEVTYGVSAGQSLHFNLNNLLTIIYISKKLLYCFIVFFQLFAFFQELRFLCLWAALTALIQNGNGRILCHLMLSVVCILKII